MRAKELKENLKVLIEKKLPVFIWGSPGIGKSSIVKSIAKEENLDFIDLRLSLLDPTDLKGIPFFDAQTKQAIWAPPAFLPKSGSGILFLDEINTAPPTIQAAAYQLILDRKIGEYELPSNWAIVAAGNLESDMGATFSMSAPLLNRFIHLYMDVDFEDWKEWALQNDINSYVIAFLQLHQEMLFTFNPQSEQNAFATPRSWEFVSKILQSNIKTNSLLEVIKGAVGNVANEFVNFLKVKEKLPNIDDILQGKDVEVPKDIATLFALNSILTMQSKKASNKELNNIIKFSLNLPKEFAIALIKDMQKAQVEVEECEAFEEWIENFEDLLE